MTTLAQTKYFDPRLFAKMANMEMIARTVVEGMMSGRHKSPFHGFSVEFSEYRKYTPGDELKYIDWKVVAKSDKVYVKQFEAETNLKAYLLVDASGSMGYGDDGMTKLEYACYCSAAMAYLMIRQMDAVGLVAFDTDIRTFIAPRNSPSHLRQILTTLDGLEPERETRMSDAFHNLAGRITRRGLILVFSDFLDEPERIIRGLAHFRHKKNEVVAFHILHPDEENFPFRDFVEFEDMETAQRLPAHARLVAPRYRKQFRAFVQDLRRRCAEHNIEYVPMRTDYPVELALMQYLAKRSRLG